MFLGIDPWQVARYVFVGGVTAAIYYGNIFLLHDVAGVTSIAAVSVAYVAAILFHFFVNRSLTFAAERAAGRQIPRYVILAAFNYFVMVVIVYGTTHWLHWSVYVGTTFGIGANIALGFIGMKHWVFAASPKAAALADDGGPAS